MCGIAGFLGQRPDMPDILKAMTDQIAHRGPDGEGQLILGPAALGHRRLAVLDPEGGQQPMRNAHKTLAVVYNGEIYNCRALAAQLSAAGHHFKTHSDTEVLLHGYEQWGEELPRHLRGMFAFAIWDETRASLFLVRDRFGVKPLYYYRNPETNSFLFASESKAFLAHPDFSMELDESRLGLYLSFQYSPGNECLFRHVKKLAPGCRLTVLVEQNGTLCPQPPERWWAPAFSPQSNLLPWQGANHWPAAISAAMQESVNAHLLADVEVGSLLSSGVDSSYVTALSGVQKTFTVRYADGSPDESEAAANLAERLGMQSVLCEFSPAELLDSVGKIQYQMDEPLADAAAAALYFLDREAARYVKVVLSGEGADELFGGYNIYQDPFTAQWYDHLPPAVRGMLGALASWLPEGRGTNFLRRRALPLAERYIGPSVLFSPRGKNRVLNAELAKMQRLPQSLSGPIWQAGAGLDPVTQMQLCDVSLWLPGDILLKADKMSMAHGLESRVPFLDGGVFQLARLLPAAEKADGMQTKIGLRTAAAGLLQRQTAQKRKLGFPVPMARWMRRPDYATFAGDMIHSSAAYRYFNVAALERLEARVLRGKPNEWRKLWCVLMFLVWYQEYFEIREK